MNSVYLGVQLQSVRPVSTPYHHIKVIIPPANINPMVTTMAITTMTATAATKVAESF